MRRILILGFRGMGKNAYLHDPPQHFLFDMKRTLAVRYEESKQNVSKLDGMMSILLISSLNQEVKM